jgi:hypothetical protein
VGVYVYLCGSVKYTIVYKVIPLAKGPLEFSFASIRLRLEIEGCFYTFGT